ncbi:hypothetical protein A9Q99_26190 [Gammaproteobacteria bacterium 45_16_T64]|nr:hypothetical protein A9Q99_26190 [Gammaproteobacteria bacterium 45_16_T64]
MKTKDNVELKRKKRNNQLRALFSIICFLALLLSGHYLLAVIGIAAIYILQETLGSDHVFYNPADSYQYEFEHSNKILCTINATGSLLVKAQQQGQIHHTFLLECDIKHRLLGKIYDPYVIISGSTKTQTQHFERSLCGIRHINLSDFAADLINESPITFAFHHCQTHDSNTALHHFPHADISKEKLLILAPHADDAELSAFGLYSQSDTHIVTITAGEIEMEDFQTIYPDPVKASMLKGRLRAWDSIAVPLWGNVPQDQCIQLGYFCRQLKAMHDTPQAIIASQTANINDPRQFRQFNATPLASDKHGRSNWDSLIGDLREIIDSVKPSVILTPHPELDPHEDHLYTTKALQEALKASTSTPETVLLYCNHYVHTDHFPFGPPHTNTGLPPNFDSTIVSPTIYSFPLNDDKQKDKIFALEMMHDLKSPLSTKKKLRRYLQKRLIGRNKIQYGNSEYFTKAIKNQEVFVSVPYQQFQQISTKSKSE